MDKRMKTCKVFQYGFMVAYLLIVLFASMGRFEMDMQIYYIQEGPSWGDLAFDLEVDTAGKVLLSGVLLIECMLLHKPKVKFAAWSIFLCSVRMLPSLMYGFLLLLSAIARGDGISVHMNICGYLLFLTCVASFVCHIIHRRYLVQQQCFPDTAY